MKKIINGRIYNTETAKELGYGGNDYDYRDFRWTEETLYQKRNGEFFIYGRGGGLSKYAERVGNSGWTSGSRIMPLTAQEAAEWAEENLSVDEYEKIFGEVSEDDSKRFVTYNLSGTAAETAKRRAAELGISASAYIEKLILGE